MKLPCIGGPFDGKEVEFTNDRTNFFTTSTEGYTYNYVLDKELNQFFYEGCNEKRY